MPPKIRFAQDLAKKFHDELLPAVKAGFDRWLADNPSADPLLFGWRSDGGGETYRDRLARHRQEQGFTDIGEARHD